MMSELQSKVSYLHDAYVKWITLLIDEFGNRELAIGVHCHPDCGFTEWNDVHLQIRFTEPLVILGELYGHMANAEEINSLDLVTTEQMSMRIRHLTDSGISQPKVVTSIVFHSGSRLDIACREIKFIHDSDSR